MSSSAEEKGNPLGEEERTVITDLSSRYGLWDGSDPVEVLARGAENSTFLVGGLVVRWGADPDSVAREADLLRRLGAATTVPLPIPLIADARVGALVYRALDGVPLLHARSVDHAGVRAALVDVLGALRRIHPEGLAPDHASAETWHADAMRSFTRHRDVLGRTRASLVEAFLAAPLPPPDARAMPQHNDLGAEHILVDARGSVTGIIDWTDAAISAPARDAGLIFRDLGPAMCVEVMSRVDGPPDVHERARIRFHARCKWLEDLDYGLQNPWRRPYVTNALRTFEHVFGATPDW
jgi:aminoglycoside phosphotransferase (APT) family kinase protein